MHPLTQIMLLPKDQINEFIRMVGSGGKPWLGQCVERVAAGGKAAGACTTEVEATLTARKSGLQP